MARVILLIFHVQSLAHFAQGAFGEAAVRGIIRDPSGRAVAGARVFLREKSKGLINSTDTDQSGSFQFPSVLVGSYVLRAEKVGFRTYEVENVTVQVGETASFSIDLTLGDVHTTITASAPAGNDLDTESNTLGAVVDPRRVQALPLNGRYFLQLALLAGGAMDVSAANNLVTANVGPPAREILLPGTLPHTSQYSLNGFDVSGARDGELAAGLSIAAIDQFKVEEGFLMPDEGPGAAAISVVTKSGSNLFHGQAFEFLRNRDLDARSFFSATADDLKRNQFGLALGGPVWRDRLWFYGFYEGLREITAFPAAAYDPTAPMFRGDLAETGRAIYDPLSYNPSTGTRTPFSDALIPSSRMNPVARNLLGYYLPGSSLTQVPANIFGNPKDTVYDDQGGLRLDYSLTARHQLSFQYFKQSAPVENPGLNPFSGTLYRNNADLAGLEHTWTISPRVVNSLRVGFLRSVATGGNEATKDLLTAIGISNTFGDKGISLINLQGYSSFGNSTGDVGNWDNTWQIDDRLIYQRGHHQFAFGTGFRRRRGWEQNSNRSALGTISFQPVFSAQLTRNAQGQEIPLAGTGDSFADFLLGMPTTGTISGLPVVDYRALEINPFVQDTVRISPHLTVNYGFSWFLETPPDPQGWGRSAAHGFNTATGLLEFAALGQMNPRVFATDRDNFAPRLGIAWSPGPLKNTVVRAGAGMYYSPMPWVLELYPLALGSPSAVGVGFTNPMTSPMPAYQLGLNVFPPAPANVITPGYAASVPPGTQVTALDPAFRTAYTSQWNVSIEHRFSRADLLELSYVGSSSHRLPVLTDLSQCRPGPDLYCSAATKPWPQYGVVYWATSAGNASSEAVISRYSRIVHGLDLHIEFTQGKTLSDAWESTLLPTAQIAACRACDKGPATFNVASRAVGSVVWEIPFGRTRVTRGWSVSAITTFATGQPILFSGPNQTGTLFLDHLPNRTCDGRDGALSGNIRNNGFLWFNTSCFPIPQPGYFGNSSATALYGPGLNNWDIGLAKATTLHDQLSLLLRAEFFNAWNHAQFLQPDGNSGDATFGRISASRPPRLIQVAVKLVW